jgi:transcription elongation factor Elf1
MRWVMKFTVKCRKCGHRNMPSNNTWNGIKETLCGEFNTCRNCGYKFEAVHVPLRPLVQKVYDSLIDENFSFPHNVKLFTYEKQHGKCPAGRGY